jgi:hypothetical protein
MVTAAMQVPLLGTNNSDAFDCANTANGPLSHDLRNYDAAATPPCSPLRVRQALSGR